MGIKEGGKKKGDAKVIAHHFCPADQCPLLYHLQRDILLIIVACFMNCTSERKCQCQLSHFTLSYSYRSSLIN